MDSLSEGGALGAFPRVINCVQWPGEDGIAFKNEVDSTVNLSDTVSKQPLPKRVAFSPTGSARRVVASVPPPLIRHELSRTTHEMMLFPPKNGFSMLLIDQMLHQLRTKTKGYNLSAEQIKCLAFE
ncbi:hypothetical protein TNCV_4695851 [Trichonephila clavipes]|nr:hypothetical protein TNCV_4695851 [Trichonephila clavipes]